MSTRALLVVMAVFGTAAEAAPTATSLTTGTPVLIGTGSTLTATVSPALTGGTVTFRDGTIVLGAAPVTAGVATLSVVLPLSGNRSLTATYGGTTGSTGSVSPAVAVTVTPVAGGWGLVAWQNTSFTPSFAQVVRFGAGSSWIQRWSPAVATSCSTTVFGGDPAPGVTKKCEVLATTPTSVSLSATTASVPVGTATTLRATVLPSSATGTVSFYDGPTLLTTVSVVAGVATTSRSFTTAAPRSLTAVFNGTPTFMSSTSAPLTLVVVPRSSTVSLRSSVNPSAVGASTVLTATVSGTAPTGTVTFKNGAAVLGSVQLVSGVATRVQSFGAAGPQPLTAVYSGDGNHVGSTSATLTQTVSALTPPPTAVPSAAVVQQFEYDPDLRRTRTITAPGVPSFNLAERATFDAFGRPETSIDAKNATTTFQYSPAHALVAVRDPRNLVTQYLSTGLRDVRQVVSPDTGTASATFDAAGNELTRADARGAVTTSTYDALNRRTSATVTLAGQTQVVQWRYDEATSTFGKGRLTSTLFPGGSQQLQYDARGETVSETFRVDPTTGANTTLITRTVGYGRDTTGALTTLTYPSGCVVRFTRAAGVLEALSLAPNATASAAPLLSGLRWSVDGRLDGWNWHLVTGPATATTARDTMGRPMQYQLGKVLRQLSYDPAGRITGYAHFDSVTGLPSTSLNQQFGYDEAGRLTVMLTSNATYGLSYDATGNRTSLTTNLVANTFTNATDSNWLLTTSNPVRALTYDQVGNVSTDSATGLTMTHDALGRVATARRGTTTGTYTYDANGRRVRKFTSAGASSTVIFVYDADDHLLGEYSSTGAPLREYVWVHDTPVAMFIPNGALAPTVYFIHADHLGAPRALVDTNGALRWTWFSEPFGSTAPNTNPSGVGAVTFNLRFPGQYADAESGLFYNWARYYDPVLGRYTQSDPIGLAGGLNTFTYANGNPVSLVDPTGHFAFVAAHPAVIGAAVATVAYIGTVIGGIVTSRDWRDQRDRADIAPPPPERRDGDRNSGGGSYDARNPDASRRQSHYNEIKKFCSNKPPPTGDHCTDLAREANWAKRCAEMFDSFSTRWPGSKDHAVKISDFRGVFERNRLRMHLECSPDCPTWHSND